MGIHRLAGSDDFVVIQQCAQMCLAMDLVAQIFKCIFRALLGREVVLTLASLCLAN